MLLPASDAESHASLAKEFCDRRAAGATSFLVANRHLFVTAKEKGLLVEGPPTLGKHEGSGTPSILHSSAFDAIIALNG